MKVRTKLFSGALLVGFLACVYWILRETDTLTTILDTNALHARVVQLGAWGPAAIIALMMLAILVSPIPSAPIALAAGAAYGHSWGTLYVLLGAEAGAVAAFAVTRFVGYESVHRWFGDRLSIGLIGSQNVLMGIVFVSRILPFISFDIVSYAAGLTVLSFWRFAIATLAGIAPTSFLLAHFGSEMGTGQTDKVLVSVLALGGLTLIPVGVKLYRDWRARRRLERHEQ
ncbi:VTT domain-containing protein [Hydrogenophaga sp. PAMC20947]|uniref:TVP38/TMEM64 family protein n=1 Tax=Hydrogenophaga sp. PAMC20947 TaxID=2565558 RepID=UPI00109D875A|nr:VTT domain-containing protein [Hydrogenophaga sp. PAMC20947]QCB45559.1 TVP38/TMEM64 family protein [Hydrogenophaga sp. PAMC20947]